MSQDPLEAAADEAVHYFREFIHNEKQIIREEHELKDHLLQASSILAHVGTIQDADDPLVSAYHAAHDSLTSIIELLEKEEYAELKLVREEKRILRQLDGELAHREWRAIKRTERKEGKVERKVIRLELKAIMRLHREFEHFKEVMEQTPLGSLLHEQHLSLHLPKESHKEPSRYYLIHLYKMLRSYERILRDLMLKEKMILDKGRP